MARYRGTLAYDGTAYQGFQRQAGNTPTVQKAVEDAIAAVTGAQATVIGAGRTDTGVHATGQVIAFEAEWRHDEAALLAALNVHLPPDVALQNLVSGAGFHPRFDATSRVYRYTLIEAAQRQPLLRNRAWWWSRPLDLEAISAAAALLMGRHDFAAFGQPPSGDNTVRTVFVSEWTRTARTGYAEWVYTVEADAFLKHMVRRIVGALVDVGSGRLTVERFAEGFASAHLLMNWTIAPPQGLVLVEVKYPPAAGAVERAGDMPALSESE